MTAADLEALMNFARKKTLDFLDGIAKSPDPKAILGWRPGPGRAHIAWQLMHIAATDDRHLNVRMRGGEPQQPELVRRYAGGSTPDDDIPSLDAIREYLTTQREAILAHLRQLPPEAISTKPNAQAPWVYEEWYQVLAWHEAHHQGQAHLTRNLQQQAGK